MMTTTLTRENDSSDQEILIVEDSVTQAEQLRYILETHHYRVAHANNGANALSWLAGHTPKVIISDVVMPEMDGYELCRHIREDARMRDIPIILVTALSAPEDVMKGLEAGANNFVRKPYDEKYLIARIQNVLENVPLRQETKAAMGINIFFHGQNYFINSDRLQILDLLLSTFETAVQQNHELMAFNGQLEQKVQERTVALTEEIAKRRHAEEELRASNARLRESMEWAVKAMAQTVECRDPYTAGHQRRVTELALAIAKEIGFTQDHCDGLRMAGMIHDIGKISVPAEILSKPSRLSHIEFSLIKVHPKAGYEILKGIDFPWPIAQIIYQHHERINGSGYPQGLVGQEILAEAKILAVADVVEAMASHRPYRPGLGIKVALDEIQKNKGTFYDPVITDTCLRLFREKDFHFEDFRGDTVVENCRTPFELEFP
jgi:putative two-component system response regulator